MIWKNIYMIIWTCKINWNVKHQLFLLTYSNVALNSSYLTDYFPKCLFTSLKFKTSLTLPLEFTKMERELVTKGTASRCCFEIKVKSVSVRFLSPLRQIYPSVIQNYRSWVIYLVIKNKMQFLIFNASF